MQRWYTVRGMATGHAKDFAEYGASVCAHCQRVAMWHEAQLIYPEGLRLGSEPIEGMPDAVVALYNEARDVSTRSPRSAAALLRLALQLLLDEIRPGKGQINDKIGALVKDGLDVRVQQAMDALRVIGNNALHPGEIDIEEDDSLVPGLFAVINMIVEQMILRPAQVAALYDAIPQGAADAIRRRDGGDKPSE